MDNRDQLLNDVEEAQRLILEGDRVNLWTAIPGIIESVNFTEMTCVVQPSIQGVVEDADGNLSAVDLPLLADVPIVFPSGGGFTITMPLAVGDEVLVVFSSRCIDAWWQSGGTQQAIEARMHDLSDGFAIPGPKSIPKKISGINSTDLQIRNNAGTSYVSITADGHIKLVSPAGIQITGNVVVDGEVTANGVHLSTHVHSGVTTGGSNTGAPV